jgi:uncharacterized protein (TIGR03000 family)
MRNYLLGLGLALGLAWPAFAQPNVWNMQPATNVMGVPQGQRPFGFNRFWNRLNYPYYYGGYYGGGDYSEYGGGGNTNTYVQNNYYYNYAPANPAPAYAAPAAPAKVPEPPPAAVQTIDYSTRAFVTLNLPNADAEVWIGTWKLEQTGTFRTFLSPELQSGRAFIYDLRVRWKENGKAMERTLEVPVKAGARPEVTVVPSPAK